MTKRCVHCKMLQTLHLTTWASCAVAAHLNTASLLSVFSWYWRIFGGFLCPTNMCEIFLSLRSLPEKLTFIGPLKISWNVWQHPGIVVNQNLAKEVTSARADKQLQTLQVSKKTFQILFLLRKLTKNSPLSSLRVLVVCTHAETWTNLYRFSSCCCFYSKL